MTRDPPAASAGVAAAVLLVAACAGGPRVAAGPPPAQGGRAVEEGLASYYGAEFQGRRTASGIPFDRRALVAAHPTLPFGTRVRVSNLATGASVVVRIVDRGPAAGPRAAGVIIDVSEAAAERLGLVTVGRARVRVQVLDQPIQRPNPARSQAARTRGSVRWNLRSRSSASRKAAAVVISPRST